MRSGVIAVADQARSLGDFVYSGLGQVSADDAQRAGDARVNWDPITITSDEFRTIRTHARGRSVWEQAQQQGEGSGTNLAERYVVAEPVSPPPGTTIPANADMASPNLFDEDSNPDNQLFVHAYLLAPIEVPPVYAPNAEPPVDGEVSAVAVYPLGAETANLFEVGDFDPTYEDQSTGLIMGGLAWDIVAADQSTPQSLTLRNRGRAAMIVKFG